MLKCHINRSGKKAGKIWIKATGTAENLMVETAALIKTVYKNINAQNPEAAKGNKDHLIGLLLDPESPIWKED